MGEKAITPIIAIVLMMMLAVSMSSMAYVFLTRVQTTVGEGVQNRTESMLREIGTDIRIDNVVSDKIYIRNTGSVDITNKTLALYVDKVLTNFTLSDTIKPGSVGTLVLDTPISSGSHTIKVTAGGSSDSEYVTIP